MGMRGPGATPFASMWRAAIPKPKHLCRYCRRVINGRRSDAHYCSNSHKTLHYFETASAARI